MQVTRVQLSAIAAAQWGVTHAWEHRIRLVTGRTHQIRTQLAAVGAPVLGDLLYTALLKHGIFQAVPSHSSCDECAPEPCSEANKTSLGKPSSDNTAQTGSNDQEGMNELQAGGGVPEWVEDYRNSVRQETPLGLQAHELQVHHVTCMGAPPVIHSAGCPWWRCSGSVDKEGVVT